jgi:HK97 gp10 family phage protein
MIDVKIRGFDEVKAALNQLDRKMAGRAVMSALRKGAEPALARARALVPRDSGFLAKHLSIRPAKSKARRIRVILTTRTREPKTRIQRKRLRTAKARVKAAGVKVDVRRLDYGFYSHFLEFGTKTIGRQQFLGPAMRSTQTQFVARFSEAMRLEVDKALAEGRRR